MNEWITVLLVLGAVVLSVMHFARGRSLLDAWAEREGLQLVSANHCWLWRGPFWWRSSKSHAVYRVVVRSASGAARSGYVRCGSFFAGVLSGAVAVEWDD
jgi:hypothetical protein